MSAASTRAAHTSRASKRNAGVQSRRRCRRRSPRRAHCLHQREQLVLVRSIGCARAIASAQNAMSGRLSSTHDAADAGLALPAAAGLAARQANACIAPAAVCRCARAAGSPASAQRAFASACSPRRCCTAPCRRRTCTSGILPQSLSMSHARNQFELLPTWGAALLRIARSRRASRVSNNPNAIAATSTSRPIAQSSSAGVTHWPK